VRLTGIGVVPLLVAALTCACTADSSHRADQPRAATSSPTVTGPTWPSEPTVDGQPALTARQVVDDPDAQLLALAVSPDDPDVRLASWALCLDGRSCQSRRFALVVTEDGFASRSVVALPPRAQGYGAWPAGDRHFVVRPYSSRRILLVGLDGRVRRVTTPGDEPGPMRPTEVVVPGLRFGAWVALDPLTGSAHRLSTPAGTDQLLLTPAGQLRAVTSGHGVHYAVSDDRGVTWRVSDLPVERGRELPVMLPSAREDTHAVLLGGDGATLLPWGRVLRSTDGRDWTSYDGPGDPTAYVGVGAITADGGLLLDVLAWSDRSGPVDRRVGLWSGRDWDDLAPVELGEPLRSWFDPIGQALDVLSIQVSNRGVTVWAAVMGDDPDRLVACTDAGRTCRRERAR